MVGSMTAARLLVPLAAVLGVAAIWLALDNPDIDGTSRGESYPCLAPWDTVLNEADNFPGGEPPPDGEEIASRCRSAGRERFGLATGSLAAAVVLVVLAAALPGRRSGGAAVDPSGERDPEDDEERAEHERHQPVAGEGAEHPEQRPQAEQPPRQQPDAP